MKIITKICRNDFIFILNFFDFKKKFKKYRGY